VITPLLSGTVCTTRAETVLTGPQQALIPKTAADLQIKLLLEHIEAQLGQDQAHFDEAIRLLLTACILLPTAFGTGQQLLSELPQRLSIRSKEM
jgi:hypothetical protein